jgi:tRNA A37 threonylcarbamoyladenosine synthetase subunit TsaC/SUA5/YrdC
VGRAITALPTSVPDVVGVLGNGGLAAVPWGRARRATYVLLTRADDARSVARLNRLKGRSADQVLGIAGVGEFAACIGDLSRMGAFGGKDCGLRISKLFSIGPVAVRLPAAHGLPTWVTSINPLGSPTVMLAGEAPAGDPRNFYALLVRQVAKDYGVYLAGSSGNRSGRPTYAAREWAEAEADLLPDVDVFVRPGVPIPVQQPWDSMVSCTVFDLTVSPICVVRHGSAHPRVFRRVLGAFTYSPNVERIPGRQGWAASVLDELYNRVIAGDRKISNPA